MRDTAREQIDKARTSSFRRVCFRSAISYFMLRSGYLRAVWPEFFGCIFEVWPAPGARESLQKCGGLRPPPPGPARLQKCTPKNPARLPSGTQLMVRISSSGLEIGLPGRMSAGFSSGKPQKRSSGRPSAGRKTDLEVFPSRLRPKFSAAAQFLARKFYCVT